ncbi:hypothetical protein GCM10007036_06180 [Alsobacter metallidurans]|uniref:DUF1684 domain-containing protein n=1 Tax=Alsobacter metallidurans TaxID=340221 RepID=A0A917MFN8_9HYPH|nr:DUF1684 domain-containing protein [Alsobacter metallidurans]GGH09908.1 hypothetical protein GCM10007036_06180 [Alsobacter metallidurans]
MLDEQHTRERGDARAKLDLYKSLLDWRRTVGDLYADIRMMEPEEGWALWRDTRDRLFRSHAQSPLSQARRTQFEGVNYFPYDPALRFTVALQPAEGRETLQAEAGKDGLMTLVPFALTQGLEQPLGKELTLYWINGYAGGVFLPFNDATNGWTTFAGGRYLLDTIKSADLGAAEDGRLILDFNFSYYPSCAYSEAWVCPLSPIENRLKRAIAGGERDAPDDRREPAGLRLV